jgi:hypothetical protein
MAKTKSSKKVEKCECGKDCKCASCGCKSDALPICFLACVLTAVLVALTFAISFTVIFDYSLKHKYGQQFMGQFATELQNMEEGEMLSIGAGSVIDFYESGQTGFIYASSDDCTGCVSFEERLTEVAGNKGVLANVYHYNYPKNNEPSQYDNYAEEITLNGEQAPVLLYVREGKIYDRLDETNGSASVETFIEKYKD